MDNMEWSFDGSIISLSSVVSSVHTEAEPPPPSHSRGPPPLAPPPAVHAPAPAAGASSSSSVPGPVPRMPSPPERAHFSSSSPHLAPTTSSSADPTAMASPVYPFATHTLERPPVQHSHSHPLASFLLAEHSLSPPASPTASVASSFPGSLPRPATRAGDPSSREQGTRSRSRNGRRRARARERSGSASSTASTDGSAHEDRAGELSSEDDHHAGGLVMPSLHLEASTSQPVRATGSERGEVRRAKLLVLGKTPEDRRTLATLLGHDDDDVRPAPSGDSEAAATDLSYSFLSMRPSVRSASGSRPRATQASERPEALFEELVHYDTPVALYHPRMPELDMNALVAELTCPLERLEAKLSRSYPSTTGLAQVVRAAGCGEFEACLFLFSSPPLASEIALARPVSHALPIFPVLVLPPSPNGRPQKTTALSQAVQEQLNTAGVRWLPALAPPRSPASPEPGAGCAASPLYMLPHDLFVQHPEPRPPHPVSSVASMSQMAPSSPESEDAPPSSLSSSQEFMTSAQLSSSGFTSAGSSEFGQTRDRERGGRFAPLHGVARSLSASSRAGSSSSRSSSPPAPPSQAHGRLLHGRNSSLSSFASSSGGRGRGRTLRSSSSTASSSSTSLADLYRLQALVHDPEAPTILRSRRARAFLEWRDIEVAASACWTTAADAGPFSVPEEWGEELVEGDDEAHKGGTEQRGGVSRRRLDFSRRVAERRKALARQHAAGAAACGGSFAATTPGRVVRECLDDGDVLAASEDEGEPFEAGYDDPETALGTSSFATDPMTPRCTQRQLLSPLVGRPSGVSARVDSYFPPFGASSSSSAAPPIDALASSTHSLASDSTFSSAGSRRGATGSTGGSSMGASSVLVLPSADPFHLPSLLHLVGLNLRLAVFAPTFASSSAASTTVGSASSSSSEGVGGEAKVWPRKGNANARASDSASEKNRTGSSRLPTRPWTWWRTAAVVSLVFAAGVAVGVASSAPTLSNPNPTTAYALGGGVTPAWAPHGRH